MLAIIFNTLKKLAPWLQWRNPIIFTIYIAAILMTYLYIFAPSTGHFSSIITLSLWITIIFANFAEAFAEQRGKAKSTSLQKTTRDIFARKMHHPEPDATYTMVPAYTLCKNDVVLVKEGELIPRDGEIMRGIAAVNESAITGESALVIRESGGDRNAVTGGTLVVSDWLLVKISANLGETYLDRMVNVIEASKRSKTPNELALSSILAGITLSFLWVNIALFAIIRHKLQLTEITSINTIANLIALFVCLAPTTIGGLLSAIGISGVMRMNKLNVIALSGSAVENAGNIDVLLLDKTGTITVGNRDVTALIPATGVDTETLYHAIALASYYDETYEGRSIMRFLDNNCHYQLLNPEQINKKDFIGFSAYTGMSGINLKHRQIRKGSVTAISNYLQKFTTNIPSEIMKTINNIASNGGTPLVVADGNLTLGVIHLKDIVKPHLSNKFLQMRKIGIKTMMITGDNVTTAASIAAEAQVDDFVANVTPEKKLKIIRDLQAKGLLVAMTGDGTNDAPALAQADIAVVMQTGTQVAKEASNFIDLDSNPAKLMEIILIGKNLLITRGALTVFSLSNDLAKYFAILPAVSAPICPQAHILNIMRLSNNNNAIIAAVLFNAFSIILLVPIAIRGVRIRQQQVHKLLLHNTICFGGVGIIFPFFGIKIFDLLLNLI
jgi:K+-transporting ATPase ATPase B chain